MYVLIQRVKTSEGKETVNKRVKKKTIPKEKQFTCADGEICTNTVISNLFPNRNWRRWFPVDNKRIREGSTSSYHSVGGLFRLLATPPKVMKFDYVIELCETKKIPEY